MTLPRSERGPGGAKRVAGAARAGGERADAPSAAGEPAAGTGQVSRSVELDAAPAEVWDALTEETLLAEWLADEVEIEAEPGGEIVCRYADGEERRGEVELVEEAERLAWSWRREGGGSSRVELVLDAVADRTRLTVIESPASETGASGSFGPLLAADAASRHTPLHAAWGPPLARLRTAVRLVLA